MTSGCPPPSFWTRSTTVSPSDAVIFRQPLVSTPLLLASSEGDMNRPTSRFPTRWKKPVMTSAGDMNRCRSTTVEPVGGRCGVAQLTPRGLVSPAVSPPRSPGSSA